MSFLLLLCECILLIGASFVSGLAGLGQASQETKRTHREAHGTAQCVCRALCQRTHRHLVISLC